LARRDDGRHDEWNDERHAKQRHDGRYDGQQQQPLLHRQTLSLVEATQTLTTYLASLNDSNLKLDEVMIFDNHAYAEIVEKDSGIGVMEVLVDPVTKAVFPEMGPTMMWNLKYGMMSGFGRYGMMGMMMGGMVLI